MDRREPVVSCHDFYLEELLVIGAMTLPDKILWIQVISSNGAPGGDGGLPGLVD
jgi:hypothetical protein